MKKNFWKIASILIVALGLGFYNLPSSLQTQIFPGTPESITSTNLNLGLDLQGGSQLDYKIDLRKVPEADQESIVAGVREVIEKRVNNLGVAEPNIYTSEIADETHIIVELSETTNITDADVIQYLGESKSVEELSDDELKSISLEKAKEVVGKTIQLEFKELKSRTGESPKLSESELAAIKGEAQSALNRVNEGTEFNIVAQEEIQANPGKVRYSKDNFTFESELPKYLQDVLPNLEAGETSDQILEVAGQFTIDASGNIVEETGFGIVKLVEVTEEEKGGKEVETSHILIQHSELENADTTITRTKEEALETIDDLKNQLEEADDISEKFTELAAEYSDDASNKDDGGELSKPVNGDGTYVPEFEQAALALTEENQLSEIVETQFGYHLILSRSVKENPIENRYKYEVISYPTTSDPWKSTGLTGEHFERADFGLDEMYQPLVNIQFNSEGAKLFDEITQRNINQPIAIFVGGEMVSSPNVSTRITDGRAQINGNFTTEEAQNLARDLNTGAIPAPIILTGEYTIGATLGQEALSQSVTAGLYGLGLVMIFMIAIYRLSGLIASLALGIYATILIFLIKAQLTVWISVPLALLILALMVTKIVNNKDSGAERLVSIILACASFIFISYLLTTGVVLTLAGVAGLILSIGMAVDANILIFERLKEELNEGKKFQTAVENAFDKAWSSIRDSNFSTLITCAILFAFGSSIIKGFAFNLAAGVLVSMFTAITITRALISGFIGRKLSKNGKLFAATGKKEKTFKFMKKRKAFYSLSTILILTSIVSIFALGLNLGIDFKGGTLMELEFNNDISKEEVNERLLQAEVTAKSEDFVMTNIVEDTEDSSAEDTEETSQVEDDNNEENSVAESDESPETTEVLSPQENLEDGGEIDLTNMEITASGENRFIVKTKHLSTDNHDKLVSALKQDGSEFKELRFNTIGPKIGATLLKDAMKAVGYAIIMIILYVAFAFRKVSKEVSKWKFGLTAIAALLHDVIIVTGLFIILGHFNPQFEINALFITAILTVMGYSVNDTIVVFDRFRENLSETKGEKLEVQADKSLTQTLARSFNTSFSTFLALIAILVLGSPSIFHFIFALTAGVVVGTYSSIFMATPLLVSWEKAKRKYLDEDEGKKKKKKKKK